jgi:hypothetical protein
VSQTKVQSGVEVIASTSLAFLISLYVGQYLIYPAFGIKPSITSNVGMTAAFTVLSIVRSYWTRRFFNWYHNRKTNAPDSAGR